MSEPSQRRRPPPTLSSLEVYAVLEAVLTEPARLVAAIAEAETEEQILLSLNVEFGLSEEEAWLVLDQQIIHLTARMANARRQFVADAVVE